MKSKALVIVFILMIFPTICLAGRATPRSAGLVIDENLTVLAVNVNGPAYVSGIRPGDLLMNVSVEGTTLKSLAAKDAIYSDNENIIRIVYMRNDESKSVDVMKRKILDPASKSTVLIIGNSKDNYERLIRTLNFNPKIAALFPIQSTDNNLKMIRTYSNVARKTVNDMPDYVVSPGGNGFGLTALETIGNFAITDSQDEKYSLLKVNLGFRAEWACLFGQVWGNFDSSGVLEKKIIECMFDNI